MLPLLLISLMVLEAQGVDLQQCVKKVDIAFVIDGSSSIWGPDFEKQIAFVQQIVSLFPVGPDQTQIAALTFGHEVNIEFDFRDFDDKSLIVDRIGAIPHALGLSTFTFAALRSMRTELFSPVHGSRPNTPHICIVLTDGASSNKAKTTREALLAKQAGIDIFAIGIGNSVNVDELNDIVSKPIEDHLFTVRSFGVLNTDAFRQRMINTTCEAIARQTTTTTTTKPTTTTTEPTTTTTEPTTTTTEPTTTTTEPTTTTTEPTTTTTEPTTTTEGQKEQPEETCQGKEADIVFVVDRSASIWVEFFKEQMKFVADVISHFDLKGDKTRVGLISFSDTPRVEFYLDQYHNKETMRSVIKGLDEIGGITNTHLALKMLLDEVFTIKHGYRPGIAHICILITDGRSSRPRLTLPEIKRVHESGVYVFAIGVGNMTDKAELEQMASRPTKDFMYQVDGFMALPTIKNLLAYKTCEVPSGDQPLCTREVNAKIVIGLHGVGGGDRDQVTQFVKSVGGAFDIEAGRVQVGVMENCGQVHVGLHEQETKEGFVQAIDQRMPVPITSFLGGIREALGPPSASPDKDLVVILVVSGGISDIEETFSEVNRLKHASKIIVVGVGDKVNTEHLMQLASYRKKYVKDISHVFPVATADELPDIVRKVLTLLCKEQK